MRWGRSFSVPLIGITTHAPHDPDRASLDALLAAIVQGVERAGGWPVLVPPGLAESTLRGLLARLDGLLLSGGGDVDPACYGAPPHPLAAGLDPARDAAELALTRWAIYEGRPLFGICRGAQVLNVALGGTLYGDVGEHPGALRHTYPSQAAALRPHPVQVAEGTRLAAVLGLPELTVNSLHHQAVQAAAPGLRVATRAPDGLVEAVELPAHPFALAVQWHPESLPAAPEMQRLFAAFVTAAGR
ncbi:MAG: gamma-glutamyl-gamma-aminobutyrate hydrolase family protein [Anaerolineales bacterium]|nr:gamma-glutamyl-gamma-aminobutyrate hydrolase family protein [Anaerolineales bacterium]